MKALGLKAGFETIEAIVAAGYHIHERYDVQASPKLKTRSLKAGLQATETVQAAGYHIRDLGLSDVSLFSLKSGRDFFSILKNQLNGLIQSKSLILDTN